MRKEKKKKEKQNLSLDLEKPPQEKPPPENPPAVWAKCSQRPRSARSAHQSESSVSDA